MGMNCGGDPSPEGRGICPPNSFTPSARTWSLVPKFDSRDRPGFGSNKSVFVRLLIEHILDLDIKLRRMAIRKLVIVMECDICLDGTVEHKLTPGHGKRVLAERRHVERNIGATAEPLRRSDCNGVRNLTDCLEIVGAYRRGARIGIHIRIRQSKVGPGCRRQMTADFDPTRDAATDIRVSTKGAAERIA